YHGVYILSERVDRKLLDLKKIDVPEDADGNDLWDQVDFTDPDNGSVLYKADGNSASLYFLETARIDFEQDYPDMDDIVYWEPLEALIDFVTNSSDEEFIANVGSIVDIDSVVDYWLLTNVTMNRDTLKKNYFLAKSGPGKWFFVPWDYDATFDMWWTGRIYGTTSWWDPAKNNLIRRLSELTATGFNTRVKARWSELRASLFSQVALTARFTAYHAATVPVPGQVENPRERNFIRWPESGGEGVNSPELGTVAYIDDWIGRRLAFLDQRIAGQPE
ncbi:MAG: CotH kinase family protein, partial [Pseudomonadales bacterium]